MKDGSVQTHLSLEVVIIFGRISFLDSSFEGFSSGIVLQVLGNLGSVVLGEVNPSVSVGELHLNGVGDSRFARSNVLDIGGHVLGANDLNVVTRLLLNDLVFKVIDGGGGQDTSLEAFVQEQVDLEVNISGRLDITDVRGNLHGERTNGIIVQFVDLDH